MWCNTSSSCYLYRCNSDGVKKDYQTERNFELLQKSVDILQLTVERLENQGSDTQEQVTQFKNEGTVIDLKKCCCLLFKKIFKILQESIENVQLIFERLEEQGIALQEQVTQLKNESMVNEVKGCFIV